MGSKAKVLIVGGGFGGVNAASALGNKAGVDVTLVDRRNHHLFQPLLYQVAIAALSPADVASPIRSVLALYRNVSVLLGNVKQIDFSDQLVQTEHYPLPYDYLILACGSTHSYFGREEWESRAPGLKSIEEATEIRRRVLMAFEMAEIEKEPKLQKELLTFVIIGGGPTGVELAGAVGEIAHYTLSKDFRHIDLSQASVILVEGGERILPSFHPSLSAKAQRALEKLGVTVMTGKRVTDISTLGVQAGEQFIPANTVIWAAGVQPEGITKTLGVPLDKGGRVIVQKDLSIAEHKNVFVIGDQACFRIKEAKSLPGLAPAAIQMGRHAGKNILRDIKGKKRTDFLYIDKGMMATIGRASAVLEVGKIRMSGFFAWLAWLFVHILYLLGFRNRWSVFMQWSWSFFNLSRGARLITSRNWKSEKRFQLTRRYLEVFNESRRKKPP